MSNARAGPRECCGPSAVVRSGLLRGLGSGESELALGSDAREEWGQAEVRELGRGRGKEGPCGEVEGRANRARGGKRD